MSRTAPQLTYEEPDREIPDSVRVRVRSYRNKAIAQIEAHQELLAEWLRSYGHAHVSEVLLNSITVLKHEMNKLAWQTLRKSEHASYVRNTLRSDPPDPDCAPDRETPAMREQRKRAEDRAFGTSNAAHEFDCQCDMCRTSPGLLGKRGRP